MKCGVLAVLSRSYGYKWFYLSCLRVFKNEGGNGDCGGQIATHHPADYSGHETDSGPFKKFARVARANTWDPNTCASNRSLLCLTVKIATSANVARQSCSAFRSRISAGSLAAPAWDKSNPNQMARNSFSRMTNSPSSPLSQHPRLTNSSILKIESSRKIQRFQRLR